MSNQLFVVGSLFTRYGLTPGLFFFFFKYSANFFKLIGFTLPQVAKGRLIAL
jgi:hypothetical protein